jgi:MYXO-CTERM domain-containing protein
MRQRHALAMLVLALLLAAVPTAAQAKGASAATISGGGPGGLPGGPIDLAGDGEPGSGTDLANLAEAAGVFALLWEDGQSGAQDAAPAATGERGPRYTITWTFPNGAGGEDKVRQSVWPYAAGGPITHMRAGQPVLDAATMGGWFRAADTLRLDLIALGLPNHPPLAVAAKPAPATPVPAVPAPTAPAPGPASWPWVAAGIGLLVVVAAIALARRRSASLRAS